MTTPLWLHLARIGEECPQATEASFSALQRAKWERVAAYVFGMYRTPLSASGTSELASDQAYCDALLDESIRGAYKGRTGGKDYYEQGEAGGIGGDVGKQSEAKLSDPASPSLPPWPKSYDSPDEGEFYDPTDVEPWRDAALAEIERLRQRAEKAEFSARQFCGEHIGVKWSRCPACSYFAYSRRAATLERDLVEAKRDSMLWHHRYTKETEVLLERERIERDLIELRGAYTLKCRELETAKQENAALERDLDEARNLKSAALQEMAEIERAHDKRYELMEELERDLLELRGAYTGKCRELETAKRPRCDNPMHTSAGSACEAGTGSGASTDDGAGRPADALLPCPFCGGRAYLQGFFIVADPNDDGFGCVRCDACWAQTGQFKRSQNAAIASWNRRSQSPAGRDGGA